MGTFPVWVPGVPSPYANPPREGAWRRALAEHLPSPPPSTTGSGVVAEFVLSPSDRRGEGNDLDNLCEPLLSVLINAKGWVGGHRRGLNWYRVSKTQGSQSGCRVTVTEGPAPLFAPPAGGRVLDGIYPGELPRNAQDPVLSSWVESTRLLHRTFDRYEVFLQFESAILNIGNIATGRVKAMIDSLHPVLGGDSVKPQDWRITRLQVERGVELQGGVVRLVVTGVEDDAISNLVGEAPSQSGNVA